MAQGFHEDFRQEKKVEGSTERSFGLVFTVVFLLVGLAPLLNDVPPRIWSLVLAGAFCFLALVAPVWLGPLNRLWFRFGMVLHRITNPVVLGLIFAIAILPVGLLLRLAGKDPLSRRFEPDRESYWIERDPRGPAPETMKDQF
jgi:hypothetical protein